jgi:tRNA modification GTPase
VSISALAGTGLGDLEAAIAAVLTGDGLAGEVVITTARQQQVISDARDALDRGLRVLRRNGPLELAADDVRTARESLAALWGRHATDDVIDRIFSSFCLGK